MNTAKRRLYLGMLKVFNLGLMVMAFGIATVMEVRQQGGGVTLSAFLSMRVKLVNFLTFALILLALARHFLALRAISVPTPGQPPP